ncbi:MAG TPA: hypothetical protein VKB88_14605 [Bryobacteraceae bacterium]|nr:hypothetical protein [Bryobacteraceae bacterium]
MAVITAAQSAAEDNFNTHDLKAVAKLVYVVFHADRYQGRCKLYPLENGDAVARLRQMKERPEEWCRPEFMRCCEQHATPCFFTSEITKDPDSPNRWICAITDPLIPQGKYMLEAPQKQGLPIFQIIQIKGKMFAREPISGKRMDGASGFPVDLLLDAVIGDGVTLEEALYNLCSYRYQDSIGAMRDEDVEKVARGEEPSSGFKTVVGVIKTAQETVAGSLGYVKAEFSWFKNLKSLDKLLAGDKGRHTAQIMKYWQKSGLPAAIVKFTSEHYLNIDGLIIATNADGKYKRLSGLNVIDENYLEPYRAALEREALKGNYTFGDLCQHVEAVGQGLEMLDNLIETYEMVAAFDRSWGAWAKMQAMLTKVSVTLNKGSDPHQPWNVHGNGCFMRGDLAMLENLKMAADNSAADAQAAGWAWFMKMAPQVIGGLGVGEAFADFKAGKKTISAYKGGSWIWKKADNLTHADIMHSYQKQVATRFHDLNAWIANENALMHHAIGMSVQFYEVQAIALQFYVRAKVLYGLKRLIELCGPVRSQTRRVSKYNFIQNWSAMNTTFDQMVDQFGIKQYIDELCLAPAFWIRRDHLLADWLHHWMQEQSSGHRDQVIRTSEPPDPEHWFRVEFQRYWPIHYSDIADAHKFAQKFSTNWTSVDDNDVDCCFLERGNCTWKTVGGGTLPTIWSWDLLRDEDVIDSETPVRAVLVFKKDAPVCAGIPVTFQLERTDWLNVPGPVYQTVVRPLDPTAGPDTEKDKTLLHYKDRYGAVVNFSYSYEWKKKGGETVPARVYYGLKPMLETPEWKEMLSPTGFAKLIWALNRAERQRLFVSSMDMAVKYSVCDGQVQGYAKAGNTFWDSTTEVTVQARHKWAPPDPEFDERNLAKFTDVEFLRRLCPTAAPPPAPKPRVERVDVEFCVKDDEWKPVTADGISVEQPIRVIFVLKKQEPSFPVVVNIKRSDGIVSRNVRGPFYSRNVVQKLDNLGPRYKGKWGVVVTPWYYLMAWEIIRYGTASVELLNGGKIYRGVKPITGDDVCCWSGKPATADTWANYKFSVYYGVGSNDPADATEVADVAGSLLNDVPLTVTDSITGGFPLLGEGLYGISARQEGNYDGKTISICTLPLLAMVYHTSSPGNRDDARPISNLTGDHFQALLGAVDEHSDLYDIVRLGTSAY